MDSQYKHLPKFYLVIEIDKLTIVDVKKIIREIDRVQYSSVIASGSGYTKQQLAASPEGR